MNTEPQICIRPGQQVDAESLRAGIQDVAAEKCYLATVEGFSLEETRTFLQRVIEHAAPQMVAVHRDQVIGWCDIMPGNAKYGFGHVGRLGMGVLRQWRRRGLGRDLINATVPLARKRVVCTAFPPGSARPMMCPRRGLWTRVEVSTWSASGHQRRAVWPHKQASVPLD